MLLGDDVIDFEGQMAVCLGKTTILATFPGALPDEAIEFVVHDLDRVFAPCESAANSGTQQIKKSPDTQVTFQLASLWASKRIGLVLHGQRVHPLAVLGFESEFQEGACGGEGKFIALGLQDASQDGCVVVFAR